MNFIPRTSLFFLFCLCLHVSYSQSTQFEWAKNWGNEELAGGATDIAVSSKGSVFVSGTFGGILDLDPGPDTFEIRANASSRNTYISKFNQNGDFVTAHSMGGSQIKDIEIDQSDYVYYAGVFAGEQDFDFGPGEFKLASVDRKNSGFVTKMSEGGDFEWVSAFSSVYNGTSFIESITVDPSGNVYATGRFGGTVDFDPDTGLVSFAAVGDDDAFIVKLNSSGDLVWAKAIGGSMSLVEGYTIRVDSRTGTVYVGGIYEGTIDFDPSSTTTSFSTSEDDDAFLLKLDSNGDFSWLKSWGGPGTDVSSVIEVDKVGSIFVGGYFSSSIDFDPGPGVFNLPYEGGTSRDAYLLKLDHNGQFDFVKTWGGSGIRGDRLEDIIVSEQGEIYGLGFFSGNIDFDPGRGSLSLNSIDGFWSDPFLIKLDRGGNFSWVETYGGTETDNARRFSFSDEGSIYITGVHTGTADFDPGPNEYNLDVIKHGMAYILKLNDITTGLDEVLENFSIKAYPSPTQGDLQVYSEKAMHNITMVLLDMSGKIVQKREGISGDNWSLSLSRIQPGQYFLKIYSDKHTSVLKVIKN